MLKLKIPKKKGRTMLLLYECVVSGRNEDKVVDGSLRRRLRDR